MPVLRKALTVMCKALMVPSLMCKMLFIGTRNELQEIPLDATVPDLCLEKIFGEFLPIKKLFNNQNIYFVGTSSGCSCDFGIQSNKRDPLSLGQISPIQTLLNNFHKLTGSLDKWEKRHHGKVINAIETQATYMTQTLRLVNIILSETKKGNSVEMFCVWAGDYNTKPEFHNNIDTTKINLEENFEIAEKEFTTFV